MRLSTLRQRLETSAGGDAGFTLIEMVIAMQVIAILMVIAIPSFLMTRIRTNIRAASADVSAAIPSTELYYGDPKLGNNTYKNMTLATIQSLDPATKLEAVVVSTDFTTYCLQMSVGGHRSLVVRGLRRTNAGEIQEDVLGNCPAATSL
jgi:prepilin-type N-terminal cleavage/methylation domain-containing protein